MSQKENNPTNEEIKPVSTSFSAKFGENMRAKLGFDESDSDSRIKPRSIKQIQRDALNGRLVDEYNSFVDTMTSKTSKDFDTYIKRLHELNVSGIDIPRLDTAATGLSGESGEIIELVKKVKFHSKDVTDDVKNQLIKELGDLVFYWMMACQSVNISPIEIIKLNKEKLEKRYPEGTFSKSRSENRASNDV